MIRGTLNAAGLDAAEARRARGEAAERLALETLRALHRGGLPGAFAGLTRRTYADPSAIAHAARCALRALGATLPPLDEKRERAAIARACERLADSGHVERLALRSPVAYRIREEAEAAAVALALESARVETPEALAEALRDASRALAAEAEALAEAAEGCGISATLRAAATLRDVRALRAHVAARAHSLAAEGA
jgi:hypothetical protein